MQSECITVSLARKEKVIRHELNYIQNKTLDVRAETEHYREGYILWQNIKS